MEQLPKFDFRDPEKLSAKPFKMDQPPGRMSQQELSEVTHKTLAIAMYEDDTQLCELFKCFNPQTRFGIICGSQKAYLLPRIYLFSPKE